MAPTSTTSDVLIIGGGIVGLSIAYELSGTGRSVRLLELGETGREASWAGAGLLPPGSWYSDHPAIEHLANASRPLHASWSTRLREETGIDDEYEACGAVYCPSDDDRTWHESRFVAWRLAGQACDGIHGNESFGYDQKGLPADTVLVTGEAQVRNPRRLAALRAACERRGVAIESSCEATGFFVNGVRIDAVQSARGDFAAEHVCLATGAWTGALAERLGAHAPTRPIRGQMLLLRSPERKLGPIFHRGGNYIVPRRDGRVLVGATVDDVGFDDSTDAADLNELLQFARAASPHLRNAEVEASWAGLRPASADALPMIGRLPEFSNGWIASGHYRAGLQLAPATAVAIRAMMEGLPVGFDAAPLSPARFATAGT